MIYLLVVLLTAGVTVLLAALAAGARRADGATVPPTAGGTRFPGGRSRGIVGYGAGRLGTWFGLFVVPANHVGIVHRRFGPIATDPRFKRITPSHARGVQARTLLPGRSYWLTPLVHRVEFARRTDIPAGMIGLVVATDGARRPADRSLGRYVECDDFQDGERFLLSGGEQGRQLAVLRGDASYYLNTALFEVEVVARTHVEAGTIGLVIARDGAVRPPDRPFGRHVECGSFQDGEKFLTGGGEQGRQLAVLAGGTSYDINPHLFQVITSRNFATVGHGGLRAEHFKEIKIPVGNVGVVITLDGAEPERGGRNVGPIVGGHSNFRLPWTFLAGGGWRGVQEETLREGSVYALNPWFVRVVLIPTRLLVLDWTKKDKSQSNGYDAALARINVNVQGHRIQVELSQTLNIPESAAPRLVSEFGDSSMAEVGGLVDDPVPVQRFVERVLGAAVDTYFSGIAAESSVEDFLAGYPGIRTAVAAEVRNALAAWDVYAATTNMGEFEPLDPEFDEARRNVALQRERTKELEEQKKHAHIRAAIEDVEIETEKKKRMIPLADLQRKIELLGRETVAMEIFLKQAKDMKVPEQIIGNTDELANFMPAHRVLEIVDQSWRRAGKGALPPSAPEELQAPDGGATAD